MAQNRSTSSTREVGKPARSQPSSTLSPSSSPSQYTAPVMRVPTLHTSYAQTIQRPDASRTAGFATKLTSIQRLEHAFELLMNEVAIIRTIQTEMHYMKHKFARTDVVVQQLAANMQMMARAQAPTLINIEEPLSPKLSQHGTLQ